MSRVRNGISLNAFILRFCGGEGFSFCSLGDTASTPDRRGVSSPRAAPSIPRSGLSTKPNSAECVSAESNERPVMKKNPVILALTGLFLAIQCTSAQFATSVLGYDHGTGFASNFTNAVAALGAPSAGASITPYAPPFSTSQLVSIGAGGSLTLQLGTPILNDPTHPFGVDFAIFGNSFFVVTNGSGASAKTSGSIFTSSVTTRVEVSQDASTWFFLDASLAPTVGTFFPTDGSGNPLAAVNPALMSSDFAGRDLTGIRCLYNGAAGGADYDLAWARDENGNSVDLSSASYIRIDVLSGRTQIDAISAVPEPTLSSIGGLAVILVFASRQMTRVKTPSERP